MLKERITIKKEGVITEKHEKVLKKVKNIDEKYFGHTFINFLHRIIVVNLTKTQTRRNYLKGFVIFFIVCLVLTPFDYEFAASLFGIGSLVCMVYLTYIATNYLCYNVGKIKVFLSLVVGFVSFVLIAAAYWDPLVWLAIYISFFGAFYICYLIMIFVNEKGKLAINWIKNKHKKRKELKNT